MPKIVVGIAIGALAVLLASFAFRDGGAKRSTQSAVAEPRAAPPSRSDWSGDSRDDVPRLREDVPPVPADETVPAEAPGVDPYEVNTIGQVASAGLDRETELEGMLQAMTSSGVASGEWVARADARIDEVHRYLREKNLGTASELGCWNAGCGIKVTFNDARAARHPDLLTNPYKSGRWKNGVVITEPRRLQDGDTQYVGWLFFLGPLDE